MCDLRGPYLDDRSEFDAAIRRVLESSAFIRGPEVERFEAELGAELQGAHVVSCANGTDALQIAMMSLELEPGVEVVTTPYTFVSTVEVICLMGFRPVLVDVRPDTFNLDVGGLEAVIGSRTRAVVPIHLFGQCADMEPILRVAAERGVLVVEDAAQALGAELIFDDGRRRPAGTLGTIGTTSFFPTKNLGAFGDGGALLTRDPELAQVARSVANHGMQQRYHYERIGLNSRLDALQAAILRIKLPRLAASLEARRAAADRYDGGLRDIEGLTLPTRSPFSTHTFHQYTVRVSDGRRDSLRSWLQNDGIPSMVYYPMPLHLQPAFRDLGYGPGDFPVAERLASEVLSLPMHTKLSPTAIDRICQRIRAFFRGS